MWYNYHPSLVSYHSEKECLIIILILLSQHLLFHSAVNSDLHFTIRPDGLGGSGLSEQGFSNLWAAARATWGLTGGKYFYEVKVEKNLDVDLPDTEEHPNALRLGWSVDEAGLGLGEALLSYGYGSTGKVVVNNRYNEYGETYGPGDVIGCYVVCFLLSPFLCSSFVFIFFFAGLSSLPISLSFQPFHTTSLSPYLTHSFLFLSSLSLFSPSLFSLFPYSFTTPLLLIAGSGKLARYNLLFQKRQLLWNSICT